MKAGFFRILTMNFLHKGEVHLVDGAGNGKNVEGSGGYGGKGAQSAKEGGIVPWTVGFDQSGEAVVG